MRLHSFAFVTICSVLRKILNMFEKLWQIKVSSIIRYNAFQYVYQSYVFVERSSPCVRNPSVSKFAYRDQLICISSEQERISAIMCELQRIFAHRSELNQTHLSELKRPETTGIRIYANNYEPGV